MANDLLFEIGTEELPVSFLNRALAALPGLAEGLLKEARLSHGKMQTWGTPRRLTLFVEGVAAAQSDLSEQVVGPPTRIAMGEDGKLSKAGEGFAKKQGVDPASVVVIKTDKGEYVGFQREEKGKPASDVLPQLLATLCAKVPFQKAMRWANIDVAFGRPIQWLCALHGETVVDVTFAEVKADRLSRGHRFLAPETFTLQSASEYRDALDQRHVVVDVADRKARMETALEQAAKALGGELVPDAFLVEECASLVEEPFVVPGSFDERFLQLPEGVVVSVMRDHQRYFAVRDPKTGKLLPRYLNVVNTANDPKTIAAGNDRVLRARLADAQFFVDEDRKKTLSDRIPALDKVVFQAKLGSIGEKAQRMEALCAHVGVDEANRALAEQAAMLAKTDLVTLIVYEFPELQGEMGRFYALEQNRDERVADALRDHYMPKGAGDGVPSAVVSAAVALADRADSLVGCFGIGLVPSGSADPFALRRATLGVIRIALEGPMDVRVQSLLGAAWDGYKGQDKPLADRAEVLAKLDEFFRGRLKAFYGDRYPADLLEACLGAWDGESVRDFDARVKAVAAFRELPAYESLTVAFKRTFNITKEAPEGPADPALFEAGPEADLGKAFAEVAPKLSNFVADGDYEQALRAVASDLRAPIDRFFEDVFVMVEDETLRANRLRLLRSMADTITGIAHFHLLST